MILRLPLKPTLLVYCGCLVAVTVLGCAATDIAATSSICGSFRPATLIITGVPGTAYACGVVVGTANPSFVAANFFDRDISNIKYLSLTAGAAPGSYPVSAANYGKILLNYDTTEQTGFCNAPSGTIVVTSYTSPGPTNDAQRGRIQGTFSNVTLCAIGSSGNVVSHTVSGSFKIE